MAIQHLSEKNLFFLQTRNMTYALGVLPYGCPVHLYWGQPLEAQDILPSLRVIGRAFSANPAGQGVDFTMDVIPQEYPSIGNTDLRSPAIEVFQPKDGSRVVDLRFRGHRVEKGKQRLPGLPSVFAANAAQAETLVLELEDAQIGLSVELSYTIFEDFPVVVRSSRLFNKGKDILEVRRALSGSVDFSADFAGYHMVQLSGTWSRERDVICSRLRPGMQSVESRRGSSSHHHNPFIALTELGSNEEQGSAYGFNLVYSGNFVASVELDPYSCPRVQMGINPFDFSWRLEPGESFQTPEAVLAYSDGGLGGLSRSLHRFYREHLFRGEWMRKPRPVLVNNWEATYFDFDADKLEKIAAAGGELGIELFVLDDGWFGKRENEKSSLGDWVPNKRKLPGGLEDLAARINGKGLDFGLWFEPEMISEDSDLYRAHPDWCLHVPGRGRAEGRCQYILDFSRRDVRDELFNRIAGILRGGKVAYVKWDMNRNMVEVGSALLPPERQQETAHRYILGVYELMERLVTEFPEVLFEGCSGGGGRFDPGMLQYMPQIWTSDDSDAIARLKIQYGTSLAYPFSTMAAHVSVVPNHQVGRFTPFRTRGEVAFTGAFGYELDLSALSEEDREETRRQVKLYKELRDIFADADLYRLKSPFESNECAWMLVSPDRSRALVTHVNILAIAHAPWLSLKLRGLDPDRSYRCRISGAEWRGDYLMRMGIPLPAATKDFVSNQWYLVAV